MNEKEKIEKEFDMHCSEMDDLDAEITNCDLRFEDNTICLKCKLDWLLDKLIQERQPKKELVEHLKVLRKGASNNQMKRFQDVETDILIQKAEKEISNEREREDKAIRR